MTSKYSKPFAVSPAARRAGVRREQKIDQWYATHGRRCRNCGGTFPRHRGPDKPMRNHITIGHVIARAKGGPNAQWNLVPLCATCNYEQADDFWPHLWGSAPPPEYHLWLAARRAEGLVMA